MSFSTFAAGATAQGTEVQWAVGGSAVLLVLLATLALLFLPQISKLD